MQQPATGYPAPPPYNNHNGAAPQYPYAAPPQYYNPPPPRSYASRSFFRAFFATMICLAVIFGVILVITWLVLRPSLPTFTLTTLSLSSFNTSSQSLTGTWRLTFNVRNGNNKLSVNYNALRSSIFYHSNYIAESNLAPFKMDTKSEANLNATFSAVNAYLDSRVVDALNGDRSKGSVPFDVQIVAESSFRSGSWRFRTRILKVLCRKIDLGISSNSTSGELIGGYRDCQVWT
ncbi:uncharacterized protein At1g08160 [Medicago truncatula]|uniref:Late embryogenesis abundant protein n=1 Tax=Medicago truncatula TaxID=3880 RepID=A0A072VAD3_MEDTR|nr:uncharacterized protein At1g08160 [Medicago truncatula]KEH38989.1 late embryogenesis abundant protein [Medicago truncatula]